MANKIIQTRIQEKIDTLAKWQEIWKTFVPLKGEKILFQVPSGNPETTKDNGIIPPQVISKTGDGVTTLELLPWDSALAADVAAWAKPGSEGYLNLPNLLTGQNSFTINGLEYLPLGEDHNDKTLTIEGGDGVVVTTTIPEDKPDERVITIGVDLEKLKLANALHFIGVSDAVITDGGKEQPTIDGKQIALTDLKAGDVVLYNGNEFIWTADGTDGAWEELGEASSFATELNNLKTEFNSNRVKVSTTENNGLKVIEENFSETQGSGENAVKISGTNYKVDIDETMLFVFDCGSSTVNAQSATEL